MKKTMDCAAAMRQLWDYLDEELSEERMLEMRAHLERCQRCWVHSDFERTFLEALARTRAGLPCASAELRQRVMSCLRNAGYSRESAGSAAAGDTAQGGE